LVVDQHRIFVLGTEPAQSEHALAVVLLHDQINDSYSWSETKTLQVGVLVIFGDLFISSRGELLYLVIMSVCFLLIEVGF
jgi:hypothetical protein